MAGHHILVTYYYANLCCSELFRLTAALFSCQLQMVDTNFYVDGALSYKSQLLGSSKARETNIVMSLYSN